MTAHWGTISATAPQGTACAAHGEASFVAVPISSKMRNPLSGSRFSGVTSLGGALDFTIERDRRSIATGNLVISGSGCDYSGPLRAGLNEAVADGVYLITVRSSAGTPVFSTVGSFASGRAVGAFVAVEGDPECPNQIGSYDLAGSGGLPPFSPVPSGSGVNAVSWNGGTAGDIAADAGDVAAVSVTTSVGGKPVLLIPGAPEFVNAAFNAAFPGNIAAGTIVFVRR